MRGIRIIWGQLKLTRNNILSHILKECVTVASFPPIQNKKETTHLV